jgi:hypothetical protein
MPRLSDAELKAIEVSLNRFEPVHIREAIDLAGATLAREEPTSIAASGPLDFGSVPAGVLVYRTERGQVRLRLTITEMTGGSYEEFELTDAQLAALARAATDRLERRP